MHYFKNTLKNRHYVWLGVFVCAGALAALVVWTNKPATREFVKVTHGVVSENVSVTGHVKALKSALLGIEKSGRVSWIAVSVGERVAFGQPLLAIENGDLLAERDQARANVKKEEAKLIEKQQGTRVEEVSVAESTVESGQAALEDAKKNFLDTILDTYTKSDDAIRNKVDQFFSNPRSQNPR